MYYISLASSPNTHLHTDNKFYLGFVCTRGCEIKSYKTKTNADKMCAKLNARAKQQKYIVTTNSYSINNMNISEAYTTIDNCNHFIANAKKFLMLRLGRFIGVRNDTELKVPVSVEIPERGIVDVCKVSYVNEDCLWLYWKDPKVIPSGYNVIQSWMAERVEGNHWVEKLKQIVDQFEENFN